MTSKKYHHGDLRDALLLRAVEVIDNGGVSDISLRGLARDIGVSHSAPARHFKTRQDLLSALATTGYHQLTAATLALDTAHFPTATKRLNAMGKGFLHWVLANQALYRTILHPDVSRHAEADLLQALSRFIDLIKEAVAAAQKEGWQSGADFEAAWQFTLTASTGIAYTLTDPLSQNVLGLSNRQAMADRLVDLIVPIEPEPS